MVPVEGTINNRGPIMEVQIGPRGPVTHPVIPATDKRPPPINHGSNYQQNVNPGMFYSSDRSSDNLLGNLGSIGGVQVCESPASRPSMFDSVSAHIPLKIKEKVWAGEYIDMSLMLKSGKDLVYDSQLNGELVVKGGQLTVLQQKHNQIKNIHTWTSAFINFMSIMLEKWPEYILNICMLLNWRLRGCQTWDGFRMTNNFVYGRPGFHSHRGPMLM